MVKNIFSKKGYLCPNCGNHFSIELEGCMKVESDKYIPSYGEFEEDNHLTTFIGGDSNDESDGVIMLFNTLTPPFCSLCDCLYEEIDIDIYDAIVKFTESGMKTAFCCSGHVAYSDGSDMIADAIVSAKRENKNFLYDAEFAQFAKTAKDIRIFNKNPISCYIDFIKDQKINDTLHKVVKEYIDNGSYDKNRFIIKLFDNTSRYAGKKYGEPISELVVAFSRTIFKDDFSEDSFSEISDLILEANRIMLELANKFKEEYKNEQ